MTGKRNLILNGVTLPVKDTACAACGDCFVPLDEEDYPVKRRPKLWLYVNVTNCCSAGCPFCVNPRKGAASAVDPAAGRVWNEQDGPFGAVSNI